MTRPRLHLFPPVVEGAVYELSVPQAHYVGHVLRLGQGDLVTVLDGQGGAFVGKVLRDKERMAVAIIRTETMPRGEISITLAQALPKHDKLEHIIRKAVELDVNTIVPFLSARSVPRIAPEQAKNKHRRWTRVALEAARQCGRADTPTICPLETWEGVLKQGAAATVKLFFWEEERETGLKELLRVGLSDSPRGNFFLIVGPEGGFTPEEAAMARGYGFQPVSLGRRLLKVETAVLVVCTLLQYEEGVLFDPLGGVHEH